MTCKSEIRNRDVMEKIGIYICNYNKKEYVLKCVESLLKQTLKNVDIYVVDNASEDGSAEALECLFGQKISIIRNCRNLGGSGGFNTGLRDALQKNYEYAVLMDNDVWVEKNAVQIMYEYMERHDDVGILGPAILRMDRPEIVQDLGGSINERYNMQGNYSGQEDTGLPEELDCAYISTCTAMARIDAVKKFGLMPEENFIYWDDVEWSRKCQLHGYRTVAVSAAKVWHNHSITAGAKSSFVRYYLTRNRLHFLAKYLDAEKVHLFYEKISEEIYSTMFMYDYQGFHDLAQTVKNAWQDFLDEKYGKAAEGRILQQADKIDPFAFLLTKKEKIYIVLDHTSNENEEILRRVKERINQLRAGDRISICNRKEIRRLSAENDLDTAVLRLCDHIKNQEDKILPEIYVDKYCHCITSEKDYNFLRNYKKSYEAFKENYENAFIERMLLKRKHYE